MYQLDYLPGGRHVGGDVDHQRSILKCWWSRRNIYSEFTHDAIAKRGRQRWNTHAQKNKEQRKGKRRRRRWQLPEHGSVPHYTIIRPLSLLPGLHPHLLRALTLQGYRTPTPIQRATIPSLLATPPRDLVGMARTGSVKTLAYMIT